MEKCSIDLSGFIKDESEKVIPSFIRPMDEQNSSAESYTINADCQYIMEDSGPSSYTPNALSAYNVNVLPSYYYPSNSVACNIPYRLYTTAEPEPSDTNSGYILLEDKLNNNMYARAEVKGKLRDKYFCTGCFQGMRKQKLYVSKKNYDTYFLVSVTDKARTKRFVRISKHDLNTPGKAFNIFSEAGIIFTQHRSSREALDLLLKYLYSNIEEEEDVFYYTPGWYDGRFEYCTEDMLFDTPFFSKRMQINEEISQAKAAYEVLAQVKEIAGEEKGLIFFILQHYALIVSLIPEKCRLKKPVVIFGRYGNLKRMANTVFRFYNRDSDVFRCLYDKNLPGCLDACKDETALLHDSTDTGYRKKTALNKYNEIKDYIRSAACECLCVILSDCGVIDGDESSFHITADDIGNAVEECDVLPTHIRYFTQAHHHKTIPMHKKADTGDAEINDMIDLFYSIFCMMNEYYFHYANMDLLREFHFGSFGEVLDFLTCFVRKATEYTGGEWMCEIFKAEYLRFRNTGKIKIRTCYNHEKGDFGDKIVVLDSGNEIMIKSREFDLLLADYPEQVRRIDVLKALRRQGVLRTDASDRFTKNKVIDGKVTDVIAVSKSFLEPDNGDI